MNTITFSGNLGKDAEIRYFPSGDTGVAEFSLGNTVSYKDKAGNQLKKTTWMKVKVFGSNARMAFLERALLKGRLVIVHGSMDTDTWNDKQTGKEVRSLFLKADEVIPVPKEAAAAPAANAAPEYSGGDYQDYQF